MTRSVIDPVTRIEGHLRVEMEVENGKVSDAWVSGGCFRGIELVVENRTPEDAAQIVQRICGVCPVSHAHASSIAAEKAYGITISNNARIIRNILEGAQFLHSHILWFYNLAGLDYVNPLNALKADPADAMDLARAAGTSMNSDFVGGIVEACGGFGQKRAHELEWDKLRRLSVRDHRRAIGRQRQQHQKVCAHQVEHERVHRRGMKPRNAPHLAILVDEKRGGDQRRYQREQQYRRGYGHHEFRHVRDLLSSPLPMMICEPAASFTIRGLRDAEAAGKLVAFVPAGRFGISGFARA